MKKNIILLLLFVVYFSIEELRSAIIQVAAPADLNATVSGIVGSAGDGDIIELITPGGVYTWTSRINSLNKSITIRKSDGLSQRPVIELPSTSATFFGALISTPILHSINFDGIEFVGNSTITNFLSVKDNSSAGVGGDAAVTINNCYFHGFASTATILSYTKGINWSSSDYYSELNVTNSEFDGMGTLFVCGASNATPSILKISNCYFVNMGGNVLGTGLYQLPEGLIMDHCTFNNCANASSRYELFIGYKSGVNTPAIITNTLFANRASTSATANVFGTAVPGFPNANNAVYYTTGDINTVYPQTLNYTITSDPVIINKVATSAPYLNAGSDGKVIGYIGNSVNLTTNSSKIVDNLSFCIKNDFVIVSLRNLSTVEIYSIDGILLNRTIANGEYKCKLGNGVYVLRINGKSSKFII